MVGHNGPPQGYLWNDSICHRLIFRKNEEDRVVLETLAKEIGCMQSKTKAISQSRSRDESPCLFTLGYEGLANQLVRQKYYDEFVNKKDLYLFLGTTQQYHAVAPNPFVIIGVFYPPKPKEEAQSNVQQLSLF